ncbi:MAG: EamA family transporter [Pararhizobium sp.]
MSGFALAIVLAAAVLHAVWNAIVKAGGDRAVVLGAISFANFVLGALLILAAPAPAPAAWPFIVASAVLHYGYYIFLFYAYRFGDLSHVYPIARGIAPALVALGAYATIGETLSGPATGGLAAISVGIMLLAFGRRAARPDPRALAFALGTGVIIASYSVTDGIGVRLSQAPFGYIGWLLFLEFPVALSVLYRRRRAGDRLDAPSLRRGLVAGVLSVFAYGAVIYANSLAHLAAVSAVRESSVIFASLIGLVVFGERPWPKRLISAVVVAAGVIALAGSG